MIFAALAASLLPVLPAAAQTPALNEPVYEAGRFDGGRMWTFEYPPSEYFSETYGFDANDAWFERARMAAVRIPGCSASFVSPNGLLATNHLCVRGRVSAVSGPDEALLDNGFYASGVEQERPIPGYYADQLIAIEDVTDEIDAADAGAVDAAARDRARNEAFDRIRARLEAEHASSGADIRVQMIALYNGGRHSAYVFRRFSDIRLVFAVELEMGFFGGDPDNFTYPRYALDFAFLRVYENGEPYRPEHFFSWGSEGVEAGDVVFVIGNPGPTTRLTTMSQLEFLRDVGVPVQHSWYESRHAALGAYREIDPVAAEAMDIRNRMFSLSNSLKAATGRLDALHTADVMGRRAAGERAMRDSVMADAELSTAYGDLFDRMADVQRRKLELAGPYGAFYRIGDNANGARLMTRLLLAMAYAEARNRGAPEDTLAMLRSRVEQIDDLPPELERRFLTLRLADFERYLGPDHPVTRAALVDGSPQASAAALLAHSAAATAAKTRQAFEAGDPADTDPALALAAALLPAYRSFTSALAPLEREESDLASRLGRLKFEVYGRAVAPDATSSPRITDGVVSGFEYNGTLAPPYTTFYGIYDRHSGHAGNIEWSLPERWQTPPEGLDLSTPLNFVSTADTYGGNSGSPAVTKELALVGLNFDRNIQGLSRDYIFLPERGRNVMVDARAIIAALDQVYDADRIVAELETGRLFATEAEADRSGR
jgi:hypothetical protein